MTINIQSIHFTADRKLIGLVNKKLEKIQTYFDHITYTDVYLKLDKSTEGSNKIVEVKMNLSGNPVFASERSNTFETAVDKVMTKLSGQVKRYKEKLYEHPVS